MTDKRMTPSEAVMLCRFAKACCPQQAFDEYTPDAWHELLGDMRFEDCKEALTAVVRRQPFCSPSEIRDEVKRIRFRRIDEFGPFDPPNFLEPPEYRDWMADMYRRIGDGLTREQYDREQPQLKSRPMPELDGVFKRIPDDKPPAEPTTETEPVEENADA